jgi:hypothetical protein
MTTMRTHFTFRVDTWTPDGESIVEHVGRRRGLLGGPRHLPRRLPTLAEHTDHLAAGCARDRGQPAPALGVVGLIRAGKAGVRGALLRRC